MKKNLWQIAAALLMLFIGTGAHAASMFTSRDNCEAAVRGGLAEPYKPTAKHKRFGDKRVAGYEKRKLEGDACVDMGTAPGRRWVYLKAGTEVYTKGADVKFLAECQNDIHTIAYIKDKPATTVTATETKVITVQEIIQKDITLRENFFCEVNGVKTPAAMENGKPTCSTVTIVAPIVVDEPIRVQPHVVAPAPVPAPPPQAAPQRKAEAPCTDCYPEARVTNKVPRTDGRCVVAFRDPQGAMHYARFDLKRGTMLVVGAKVDNERGEWNTSYTPTYVGFISPSGEKKTVSLERPSCEAIVKSLVDRRVFEWTGPRLGLAPNCTMVGPVREVPARNPA